MGGQGLRALINAGECVIAPGAHNAITAQVIEAVGFPAIYMTGGGMATATFGRPDAGILTMTEVLWAAKAIVEAVRIPVIADGDTGFGGVLNVRRTVQEFEKMGAAAVHLEDQIFPKRCGYLQHGSLVDIDEMCEKIRIACDSRRSDNFLIIARTEAAMCRDFDEALERSRAYRDAGADVIFVNGMKTLEQVERTIREVPGPHLFNFSGSDQAPRLTVQEIRELGFSIVIYPIHALRVAVKSIRAMMEFLRENGHIDPWYDCMISFDEWQQISGVPEVYRLEERYGVRRLRAKI